MHKLDALIPLALAEADRLIVAGNKARDVVETGSKPPTPPAYVKVKRAQSKRKPKQLRLAIEKWNMERITA
jgi:hypothetical protein